MVDANESLQPLTEVQEPIVVAYGAGVDSTAMLIGLRDRGVRVALSLFADTGSESLRRSPISPSSTHGLLAMPCRRFIALNGAARAPATPRCTRNACARVCCPPWPMAATAAH